MISSIVSTLDTKKGGLYSQLFFIMNHYIYCKKHSINFKIDSTNWLYKSINGWTDYFAPIELFFCHSNDELCLHDTQYEFIIRHNALLDTETIESYKQIIPEIYIYNENVIYNINTVKQKLNLLDYDSIYIRRGDKLISESIFSPESKYIELLLLKNPNCHTIFLQTDDYRCYENIKKYIYYKKLNIKVVTTCNENNRGAITSHYFKKDLNYVLPENIEYMTHMYDTLQQTKTLEDMNSTEIYEHTIELLTGVDICIHSNICICDFDSNVSRFIKLAHKNTDNVFDINNTIVDFSKNLCPAYSFHFVSDYIVCSG